MTSLAIRVLMALLFCSAALAQIFYPVEINNAGVIAYNARRFEEAISLFEQAHRLDPASTAIRANLSNAYHSAANDLLAQGDAGDAIRLLDAAIRTNPQNGAPHLQLGAHYLQTDELAKAIGHLESAITLNPGDLNAHELLGQAYYMDNDLSAARAQWDYVLDMAPNRPGLRELYEKAFREESVEFDFNRWRSRHFYLSYPPDTPAAMRVRITGMLDRIYLDIGRRLGGVFPPPPIHVILYTANQFSEATQLAEHVGAVYDGKIRCPITDSQGAWLTEDDLQRRLAHEHVHVIVRHLAGANVPWWLNEGLAETLSRTLNTVDIQRLQALYADDLAFSLSELEDNQLKNLPPGSLRLAYLQAHATVDLLWNRYGRFKMVALLRALGANTPFADAFHQAYRRLPAALEREVAAAYR